MPADLLEQQTEVDQATRESARIAAQESVPDRGNLKSLGRPRKSIWREIFEDHQEFLGLTPD